MRGCVVPCETNNGQEFMLAGVSKSAGGLLRRARRELIEGLNSKLLVGENAMILRAMGLGFVLWLANAALFRFAGQYFFLPDETLRMATFAAAPVLGLAIGFVFLKVLKEARGDEGEAAISIAMPSMLLNAFMAHEFSQVFPNLDPTLDSTYGALALLYAAALCFIGLLMTRLAPQDERL